MRALPVRGKTSATSRSPSGSRFSTRLMPRASAALVAGDEPARRGWRRLVRRPSPWAPESRCSALESDRRAPPAQLPRPQRHAHAEVRAPRGSLRVAPPADARGLALADRRPPCSSAGSLQIQIGRRGTIRFGRFVWVGDGTKIRCHEGEVVIGAEDSARPGMHDLGLPARPHRRAVRDRRPRHVHRLRPRLGRGRPPDPPAGDLQARRRRGLERLDRLRRLHPAGRAGRGQRDHRHQLRRHPRRARERGRRRASRRGSSGCARRPKTLRWPDPVEPADGRAARRADAPR